MPPLKEVQSLYFLCLDRVFETLFDEIVCDGFDEDRLEKIRHYFITNLHGGIREHILKLAVLRDRNRIEVLLELINILIDPNITYLCCYSGRTFRILPEHYSALITYLKMRNAVGLKFLHIVVDYTRTGNESNDPVVRTNGMFHTLLANGLASSLTVLVLRSCCDNEILKILGKHCIHLTKLDITKSWYVNDNGIKNLCLKEPDSVENACERYSRSPQFIMKLMSMKAKDLNPCCFTLSDVRLQETNTTDVAVLMLLIFLKSLKRLGGFIYSRSVVDNIIFLSRLADGNLKMNFTEVYDTHLTDTKLNHLSNIVPDLTEVYTRNIFLHPMLAKFQKLSEVTIDFDFQPYEENFFVFISSCGAQLKRITLVDKHGYTDMLRIFKFCPNLVEINGSLTINDPKREFIVPHLKKANLKIILVDVIPWLLLNVPNLEHLEICIAEYAASEYEPPSFGNDHLENIIREKPACSNALKYLVIIPTVFVRKFDEQTIMEFILQFKELRFLGDLYALGIPDEMACKIAKKLRRKNLDTTILWDQNCESVVTMNSLKELNMTMEWKSLKPGIEKKY